MPKAVLWSPLSVTDVETILNYLFENWNKQVAENFTNQLDHILSQIAKRPKLFPLANKKQKVRKCVVNKQNTLFYRESKDAIELLRIFDTRQHPKKLKL